MAGFTTVRDVGSSHFLDVGLRNAINSGVVPGPRMLCTRWVRPGGHCGVKVALATDAAVYPHENNALEFVVMNADGMTPANRSAPELLRPPSFSDCKTKSARGRVRSALGGRFINL